VHEAGDPPATLVLVAADGREMVLGPLAGHGSGLDLVEALARMALGARRQDARLAVRDAPACLWVLLRGVGLADLLLEVRGQPEGGEELGVEEVVQRPDAPA
jgi:hypothetical protein